MTKTELPLGTKSCQKLLEYIKALPQVKFMILMANFLYYNR